MVKRKGLGDLLRQEASASVAAPDEPVTSEDRDLQSSEAMSELVDETSMKATDQLVETTIVEPIQDSEVTDFGSAEAPELASSAKYLALVRKEARLRDEQYDELTCLARKLNKSKSRAARTERITENTLIRIVIDVLLESEVALLGDDEASYLACLRASR